MKSVQTPLGARSSRKPSLKNEQSCSLCVLSGRSLEFNSNIESRQIIAAPQGEQNSAYYLDRLFFFNVLIIC